MKKIFLFVLLFPSISFAYVDPGILSVIAQSIFALIAGGIMTWVVMPLHKVKDFFSKLFGKNSDNKDGSKKADNLREFNGNGQKNKSE